MSEETKVAIEVTFAILVFILMSSYVLFGITEMNIMLIIVTAIVTIIHYRVNIRKSKR